MVRYKLRTLLMVFMIALSYAIVFSVGIVVWGDEAWRYFREALKQ
jgi:hypothetical protein